MKRDDAAQMVNDLLLEHAPDLVIYGGWKFGGFDRAKKRYGQCNYTNRVITLSGEFVDHGPEDEIIQTILHEVAHAMAGHQAGHGAAWLATARSIGYTGERTKSIALPSHKDAPWMGKCKDGCEIAYMRKPAKNTIIGSMCKKHSNYLDWYNNRTGEKINGWV